MLSLITNPVIILLIVGCAFWQLVKVFKRAKKGKCAACDYDCAVKQQVLKQEKHGAQ
ncbi:MAG: FeoB-associated Cys-rich membrane protein [Limosilactobacillus fermentum]|nr:FeoB-associated Cys-rich membrane protein [Limosilactobacillus fermentum]